MIRRHSNWSWTWLGRACKVRSFQWILSEIRDACARWNCERDGGEAKRVTKDHHLKRSPLSGQWHGAGQTAVQKYSLVSISYTAIEMKYVECTMDRRIELRSMQRNLIVSSHRTRAIVGHGAAVIHVAIRLCHEFSAIGLQIECFLAAASCQASDLLLVCYRRIVSVGATTLG